MEDENDSREHKRASQIPTALSKSFCPKTYQFRTGCIPFSIAARWWLLRRGVMPLSRRPAVNRTWVCAGRAVDALVAWLGGLTGQTRPDGSPVEPGVRAPWASVTTVSTWRTIRWR